MDSGVNSTATPGPGNVVDFDKALWRQLLARGGDEAFFTSWLGLQAKMLPRAAGGVIIAVDEDEVLRPVAIWPREMPPNQELRTAAQSAARRRVGIVRRGEPAVPGQKVISSFAYPVMIGDDIVAVVGFSVAEEDDQILQAALRRLQWGSVWIENHFRERRAVSLEQSAARLSSALDLVAVSLESEEYGPAAIALVTEIAVRFGCERASLGFRDGSSAKVAAISHTSEINRRQSLVRGIAAAMDEAIDQGRVIVFPPMNESPSIILKHKELSERLGCGGPVVTFPIESGKRGFAAVTLEFPLGHQVTEGDLDLGNVSTALTGRVMRLLRREDSWIITKIGRSLWFQAGRLLGPGFLGRKVLALVLAGLVGFFAFYSTRFAVPAKAKLEGQVQRVLAAPFQSYVAEEYARPGDIVRAGSVLARLDDREFQLERAAWTTRKSQYEAERQAALAERDIATVNIKQAQINEAEVQLELLNRQIAMAAIIAPFDGVILSGDLSQGLGTNVQIGDPLFQIAPLDAYRVALNVDEEDIGEIAIGQKGAMILSSRPDQSWPMTVTKLTSVTVAEEGRNFFRVEAKLETTDLSLRPGMAGVAKVEVEDRLLIWIWTRHAVNWVKVQYWKWMP